MTIEEARDLLVHLNKWHRDDHVPNQYEMPNPTNIGIAIDIAIESINKLLAIREQYDKLKELTSLKEELNDPIHTKFKLDTSN